MAEQHNASGRCVSTSMPMVVTIDGPAGAGKSTVARLLARRLGYRYLDTGAMYRAATWKALETKTDLCDEQALVALVNSTRIELAQAVTDSTVRVDGQDVTAAIRDPRVTQQVYHLADSPLVRRRLIMLQRQLSAAGPTVTEGRDQGTEVFPNAPVKFYLDASAEVRARRRLKDLLAAGVGASYDRVLTDVVERDRRDGRRPVGALRRAPGAVYVDSTDLPVERVVELLCERVRAHLAASPEAPADGAASGQDAG